MIVGRYLLGCYTDGSYTSIAEIRMLRGFLSVFHYSLQVIMHVNVYLHGV
jgi:hypothetical protein